MGLRVVLQHSQHLYCIESSDGTKMDEKLEIILEGNDRDLLETLFRTLPGFNANLLICLGEA